MKRVLVLMFLFSLIISSCQKENMDMESVLIDLELKFETGDTDDQPCFVVNFPVTIVLPNGTEVEGDSKEELNRAIKRFYRSNDLDKSKRVEIKYPLSVDFKGKTLDLENARQFQRIKLACGGDKNMDGTDKVPCISLVYPVTFVMPDRSLLSVESKRAHAETVKKWFEEHPDYERKRPSLQYPVDVLFQGKQITLESERGMLRLKEACKGDADVDKKPCFKMVYPLTYSMPDDSSIEVKSKEHAENAFKRWYNANPRLKDKKPVLQFPIDIMYPGDDKNSEGKVVKINDQEELRKAFQDCKGK